MRVGVEVNSILAPLIVVALTKMFNTGEFRRNNKIEAIL